MSVLILIHREHAAHLPPHLRLRLHGFLESLEIAPVLLAAEKHYDGHISLHRGGIANLVRTIEEYCQSGVAAIHIEDQQLDRIEIALHLLAHVSCRIIHNAPREAACVRRERPDRIIPPP